VSNSSLAARRVRDLSEGAAPSEPRRDPVLLGTAALWTGLAALLAIRLAGLAMDDFYITYRYAWNLAHGNGFVFNPGERVFGLTDPGLGLLLAALHAATRAPIPWLGTAVTGAALVGIALALLLDARERGRRREALIGGTLAVTSSYLWLNQGAGVFGALLLLLLAARLAGRRPWTAGLLAGGAVWMRPDAAFGVALLGLLLGSERRRIPWAYGLAAGAVMSAGALAAWAWFGSPMPNTLTAKQATVVAASDVWAGLDAFWPGGFRIFRRHWGPWWQAVAVTGLAGHAAMLAQGGRTTRLLALVSLETAVVYPLLEVPFSTWYVVPTVLAALYGAAYLAGTAGRWLAAALGGRRAVAATTVMAGTVLLAPLLVSAVPASWRWCRNYQWQQHLKTYRQAALWIRDHSAAGDEIAYFEIGVLAYYSERPVVDLMGLVTPESIPYVETGDLMGAFLAHPTRFVIDHGRSRMAPFAARRWFLRAYEEVARFEEGEGRELTVFRRRPGAKLRPPRPPQRRAPG
jgi:hypothetical protein